MFVYTITNWDTVGHTVAVTVAKHLTASVMVGQRVTQCTHKVYPEKVV